MRGFLRCRCAGLAPGIGGPGAIPELVSMYVAPSERGTGLAGHLIRMVVDRARADHWQELTLRVACGNDRAARAYRKCGFRPTGEIDRINPDDPEDRRTESTMSLRF